MTTPRVVRSRTARALLPLEQVNPSVGPLAFLDLSERAVLETVSRACRVEVRAPVLWRQLVITKASKEAPLANNVLAWLFGKNNEHSYASLTSLNLADCSKLTGCASLKSLNVSRCDKLTDESIEAVAAGCASVKRLHWGC
jgi:hypothetical protein